MKSLWIGACAALLLLSLAAAEPLRATAAAPPAMTAAVQDAQSLLEEIQAKRDEADPELLHQLAALRTKDAADALLEAYGSMGSIFMRREVLRALAEFDGVPDAQQAALQKLMDVATTAEERELRESAVDLLGECDKIGKTFLAAIVASSAQDDVRERAMRRHVALSDEADHEWYRELYEAESATREDEEKGGRRRKRGDEEKQEISYRLASVRRMAFSALAPNLQDGELYDAIEEDDSAGVRRIALSELAQREDRRVEDLAEDMFTSKLEPVENRIHAAKLLAEAKGPRIARDFFDEGDSAANPTALRFALADLLVELDDSKVNKMIERKVGKGRGVQKLFYLRASRHLEDEGVTKSILRMLADKDLEVRIAAAHALGDRGEAAAIESLEKALKDAEEAEYVLALVHALSELHGGDPAWEARLLEYAKGEDVNLRNAAIARLAQTGKHTDLVRKALDHDQWSTRLTALKALTELRLKESVGWIVQRMQDEDGRMLHEFADVLFELTGQPYRTAKGSWLAWWEREGEGFDLIGAEELAERRQEEEDRRLKQVTSTQFFGIRIISKRVVFVIDISGSMTETLRARYMDEQGEMRITVAKRELSRAIDSLKPGSLFNVIAFNSGVDRWLDQGIAGSSGAERSEAKEWVDRLGAGGGTNVYDSIEEAFHDPEVDTIYLLSDGEPTAGQFTDPGTIRQHVQEWNETRGIVIHCIAVGGSLTTLEWLAEDSGGTYVKYN